ncbi:MAG: hypothetical protein ACO3VI_10705 [Ilumatobacteraceae bacterium]
MLVYEESNARATASPISAAYRFGEAVPAVRRTGLRESAVVASGLLGDFWRGLRYGWRLALLPGPLVAGARLKSVLSSRDAPLPLLRWQHCRATLTRALSECPETFIIFHGEFDEWGLSVVQACHRSGKVPVAMQHGPMTRSRHQYLGLRRLGRHLPAALLLFSESQRELWSDLPLPTAVVGSRRLHQALWKCRDEAGSVTETNDRILFVPPSSDSSDWARALAASPRRNFSVKPHPLHRHEWIDLGIEVVDGDIERLLEHYSWIVTGSPNVQLLLAATGRPYVRVMSTDGDGESESGSFAFASIDDAVQALGGPRHIGEYAAHHHVDSSIPPDISRGSFLAALESVIDAGRGMSPVTG